MRDERMALATPVLAHALNLVIAEGEHELRHLEGEVAAYLQAAAVGR